MNCPACGADSRDQVHWSLEGEPCWCCPFCRCLYIIEDPEHWLNLDLDILDPQPNDGWDGACGAELRFDHYEPYPHNWDYNLTWCRIRFAADSELYNEMFTATQPGATPRAAEDIPSWILRRALVALPHQYRQRDFW